MSILAERGQIGPAPVVPAQPHRPIRVVRGRRGEVQRPPTRRRLVAGRRAAWSAGAPCATPRRPATRWPWLLALGVASCLTITGLGLLSGIGSGAPVPERTETVSVEPGDTLSALAARFAPDSDRGAVVARIRELNHLDGTVLVPGLPLAVPVSGGGS